MVNNPTITPLSPQQRKAVQELVGLFRHYASCIDTTMLASLSSIATNMATSTKTYLDFQMKQFFDYATTHPDAKIRCVASDMQL